MGGYDGSRLAEFRATGLAQRHMFPHDLIVVPKGGPDGLKLAVRMCGIADPARLREVLLFAGPEVGADLPESLFFDDEIVWHQQHLGRRGHFASANLVLDGDRAYTMAYVSDLVQRISRRREHKTRVEKVFQGWSRLLHHAVLAVAVELGLRTLLVPTAALALRHTDPKRSPDPALFERVYDRHLAEVVAAERQGDWWRVDVARNRARAVRPDWRDEPLPTGKTICLCHDIERGLGHLDCDPAFARAVDGPSREALDRMLAIEAAAGVRGTYQVVGTLFDELRPAIAAGGHALAFHSFDHRVGPRPGPLGRAAGLARRVIDRARRPERRLLSPQLQGCRTVDYRIKGYRPPRSRVTADLSDARLAYYNFEWLASSRYSLGRDTVTVENGLAKLPIHLDDFPLYRGQLTFDAWRARALELVRAQDYTALSVHDCYAAGWIDGYREFLQELAALGSFRTLDEVAADAFLAHSIGGAPAAAPLPG